MGGQQGEPLRGCGPRSSRPPESCRSMAPAPAGAQLWPKRRRGRGASGRRESNGAANRASTRFEMLQLLGGQGLSTAPKGRIARGSGNIKCQGHHSRLALRSWRDSMFSRIQPSGMGQGPAAAMRRCGCKPTSGTRTPERGCDTKTVCGSPSPVAAVQQAARRWVFDQPARASGSWLGPKRRLHPHRNSRQG